MGQQGTARQVLLACSKIPSDAWPQKTADAFRARNISECWYPDWREPQAPWAASVDFWKIFVMRLAAFGTYAVLFFVLMWLVNTFVSDVPGEARTTVQRHAFLQARAAELAQERQTLASASLHQPPHPQRTINPRPPAAAAPD